MSQLSTEHAEKIAQLVAEVTVRRLSTEQIEPLRKDVSSLRESFTKLNTVVFNGGSGGLVNRFDVMEESCKKRHEALDAAIKSPEKEVSVWKERLKGAAWVFGTLGTIILGILTLHSYLK